MTEKDLFVTISVGEGSLNYPHRLANRYDGTQRMTAPILKPPGDARPRADDASELRPRRAGGRPVPRAGARGKVAVSTGSVVTIAGRAFTLGVVYAPRPASYGRRSKPRRLLSYTAGSLLPGGRVIVELVRSGRR